MKIAFRKWPPQSGSICRPIHHCLYRSAYDPVCIGQKQKWFLLKLTAPAKNIQLNLADPPEFDEWQWVSYWYPLGQVVNFKRDVYRKAMVELCTQLPVQQLP